MKCRRASSGYTILEVMIALAVSGGLLVSVMTMISGQQRRTEFATTVRGFESKLQDIFNDVETGFFPNNGNVHCTSSPTTAPVTQVIDGGVVEQGTNQDCIFLGKAIQFYKTDELANTYRVFSIAGKRRFENASSDIKDVTNINDASPRAFYDGTSPVEKNPIETGSLPNGLEVAKVIYIGSSESNLSGLAVLSAIGAGGTAGDGEKVATNIDPTDGGARLAKLGLNTNEDNITRAVNSIGNLNSQSMLDAQQGVVVCLQEGEDGRKAAITVGVSYDEATDALKPTGQRLSTEAYFDDNSKKLCES